MKAIFVTGGKQYYVAEGDEIFVEKIDAEVGKEVEFDEVLALGEKTGTPIVKGAKVVCEDIVCASVSSIIITSVNNMMSIDEDAVKYSDDGNTLIVEIVKEDKLVYRLFDNLKELLTDLSKDYPKNIRIESEE